MTDGNTGIQVAPVSKEDVMSLQGMFSKLSQVLVNASDLPERVNALQSQVQSLSQDLQNKTIHSEELERTLHEVREQRDQARNEAHALSQDLGSVRQDLERMQRQIDSLQHDKETLQHALDNARKDRDEYGMKNLELEEQVKTWQSRAEEGRKRLQDMLSLFQHDESKPEPAPVPPTQQTDTSPSTSGGPSEPPAPSPSYAPEPQQEPHPVQATEPPPQAQEVPANPAGDHATANPAPEDNRPWWEKERENNPQF